MKTPASIIFYPLFFIAALTGFSPAYAQDTTKNGKPSKEAIITNLIESQNFVFEPRTVLPMRGASRMITSYYDIRVSKDSVVCYLPYFGRAYTAPLNPDDIGLDFTSTNFVYTKTMNKKGGWDIVIKPKDHSNVQRLSFSIFNTGSASLNVTSINRDPISYDGFIRKRKQKKK